MASSNPEIVPTPGQVSSVSNPPPSPAPEWGSDSIPLKDFAGKVQVPGFAKVVKGSYMTLGSSKFSLHKQHNEVFVHSVKVAVKVLAHCLRRLDASTMGRRSIQGNMYTRLYAVDQRLAIPISYQGWFELLSEDGKSARPIATVHELSKVRPDKCLVRENMKAYLQSDEGKMTFDKSKIVLAGEQLVLAGEVSLPSPAENKKVKLLRCYDSRGECVFLSFDQKGTFTPIAGDNDFTGVFTIRDVVRRFRLPLTVKLVQGVRPKVDQSKFTGLIRLDWVYTDETAFVCPIEKNHVRLLPVPTDANLHLVAAGNQTALKSTELYATMTAKCTRMITNYNNTLHLIVQLPEAAAKSKNRANANVFSGPLQLGGDLEGSGRSKARERRLMEEIDDLYGYVRDGNFPHGKSKFTYDSDEESYWEEPAYEPLDQFQARLKALEAGERVSYPAKYQPRDPGTLGLEPVPGGQPAPDIVSGLPNGLSKSGSGKGKDSKVPPPLPPRPPDLPPNPPVSLTSEQSPVETPESQPPPVPPRRYSQPEPGLVTTISNLGLVSSNVSATGPSKDVNVQRTKTFHHSKSSGNIKVGILKGDRPSSSSAAAARGRAGQDSTSNSGGSSSNGGPAVGRPRNHIARDFKDSDISSVTRGTSSGSSGGPPVSSARKKMQTLYL